MSDRVQSSGSLWLACAISIAGLGLLFAPADATGPLRVGVRDAIQPGQQLLCAVIEWGQSVIHPRHETASVAGSQNDKTREMELRVRQQSLEIARLRDELRRAEEHNPLSATHSVPLIRPDLIEVRVLGEEMASLWCGRKLLDAGTNKALMESALVLEAKRPLLDLGADDGLLAEQSVFAGRVVVGKIDLVGKWSSTLLRVTDAGYTGRAQIARRMSQGLHFGSEGIIKGDGGAVCHLEKIPLSEPVGEGDEVYTGGTDGVLPFPMFYGVIVKAEPLSGTDRWSIDVKPAAPENVDRVQVLRATVNNVRLMAN